MDGQTKGQRARAQQPAGASSEADRAMKAKPKADATAGKQQRTATGVKKLGAAPQTQSFNSLGEHSSIQLSRAGQDSNDASEEWPRVLKIPADELEQSFALAQLAVQLCALKKEQLQKQWDADDRRYKELSAGAVLPVQKGKVIHDRETQMAGRIKTLDAEVFLPEAWNLLEMAREQVTRPQTDVEYMVAHGGSEEALENVIGRLRAANRIPFGKLCNPKRAEGDTETFLGVTWKLFTGRHEDWKKRDPWAGFEKLFWEYWSQVGENWQRYKEGRDAPAGFSTAKEMQLHYSKADIAESAKRACNPVVWRAKGTELLSDWMQAGLRPNDFLALARFRTARDAVRLKNIRPSEAETSKQTRRS